MSNVNNMEFNQISATLAEIAGQATGTAVKAPISTGEFVSVAQTALKTGYDPVLNAVSNVLARTIFSVRPYTRKFAGLFVDERKYGAHTRKINACDKPFVDDDGIKSTDGTTASPFTVNAPKILQTNFYGQNVYQKELTIYKNQLDVAFSGPDEFAEFVALTTQNVSDMIEQCHENTARATVANLIGGVVKSANTSQIVHLLTEYNTATGGSYTATTINAPDVYPAFMKWVYARIAAVSSLLTERSVMYHQTVTGYNIMRHSPVEKQRVYMYAPEKFAVESRVLADVYHDNYIKSADNETVNFWQAIKDPMAISVKPSWLKADGTISTETTAVAQGNIFAVMMDQEAAGVTTVNRDVGSIYNPRGQYSNTFWHFTDRYWNDFSENCVIFLLD